MDNQKIIQSARIMRDEPLFKGVTPRRADPKERDCDELAHILFMLIEIENLVKDGRKEKAFRWLGFIQGVLWSLELKSIADLKNTNKP
ncbi:hypothetical protein ACFL6I_10740 [candidate division KSB1 bacterium]